MAEGYVACRRDEIGSLFSVEWRQNARAIRKHAWDSAVLCFGTSLSRMGVAPRVIEERLGMPAYNFAASGSQPFACYVALRDALASGARPRAIVVDYAWTTLGQPDTFNETGLVASRPLGDLIEWALAAGDASLLSRMVLAWALPSFHGRPEVRANIAAALRGAEPERNPARFLYARHAATNRGACLQGSVGYDGSVDAANPVMFPKEWGCTAASRRYIDEFLELAASRGIPVFWALPPMAAGAQNHWASSGTRASYMAMAESIAARHPNVTLVDATTARYPAEAFNDPVHLNRDGAVVFSAGLADAMRPRLNGDRGPGRVVLADYRPDPDAGRVEDSRATLAKMQAALDPRRR
ncbi:MAG TPA: hypothetical protein VGH33_21900 [Isosphaeraceae bacterium]